MPPESKGRASHISSRSFGQAPPAALPPDTAGGGDSQRRSIADPDGAGDAETDDLTHSEDSIGEWDEGYGDSDYEEEYVDGPAEWAEVDERQLREAALHLSPLGGPAKAEAPARALGGFPKDAEYLDPLGLGGVDVKAAMLVTRRGQAGHAARAQRRQRRRKVDTSDSVSGHLSHGERLKIVPTSDRFDAQLYLALIHSETSLDELMNGTVTLQADVADRNTQLKDLVKDNFERFISCKRTIDDIHSRLRESEASEPSNGVSTSQLSDRVVMLKDETQRSFSSLLERHQQVERVRTVISLLRRFSLLFSLPARIRMHAETQDYGAVIREYGKARQLVGASAVTIWSNLMKEVDKVVESVVDDLIMQLVTPATPPEQAIDSIRNLLQLRGIKAPGTEEGRVDDPVQIYLTTQEKHYMDKFEEFAIDHACKMTNLREKIHEEALQDSRWIELQSDSATEGHDRSAPGAQLSTTPAQELPEQQLDLLRDVYSDNDRSSQGALGRSAMAEVDGQLLRAPQAMLVRYEMRLTALVSRQLSELGMAFSSDRERRQQTHGEIFGKTEQLGKVLSSVAGAYKAAIAEVVADMGGSGVGAFDGLLLIMRHLKQACMRVGADAAWPLKAHLSEVGWIATWECVERLCGQLAIPATWLVEQETWEPLPCSCYTNSDPISRTPIHLANQVATLQQQLSFVVATASVFPAGLSAKRQLNHQAKLESKISTAFYSCLHSYVDAIRKLSNNPVSGSESSAISTKVGFDGEEAWSLLLLCTNLHFVRTQLLPNSAEALTTLLRVLKPQRQGTTPRQTSSAPAPVVDSLLPSSEAYQLVEQEIGQLTDELLSAYCVMKESTLLDFADRITARYDGGAACHLTEATTVGRVVLELVDSLAAVHAELVSVAPSQASTVVCKLAGHLFVHLAQAVANIKGPLSSGGATLMLLELRYLESVLFEPLHISGGVMGHSKTTAMKTVAGAAPDLQDRLEEAVAVRLPELVHSTRFNVCCFQCMLA